MMIVRKMSLTLTRVTTNIGGGDQEDDDEDEDLATTEGAKLQKGRLLAALAMYDVDHLPGIVIDVQLTTSLGCMS